MGPHAAALTTALLVATPSLAQDAAPDPEPAALTRPDLDQAYRNRLSMMWGGVTANMIGADVLSLYIPGTQEETLEFVGSEEGVRWAMLGGALIYQVPIWMVVTSQVLPPKAARWTTVGGALVTAITIVGLGDDKPHYVAIAVSELAVLGGAVWTAARWGRQDRLRRVVLTGGASRQGPRVVLAGQF